MIVLQTLSIQIIEAKIYSGLLYVLLFLLPFQLSVLPLPRSPFLGLSSHSCNGLVDSMEKLYPNLA